MSIKKVCTSHVVTLPRTSSIEEAAKLMKRHQIGDIVIIEDDKPIGLLTDRDIVMRLAANEVDFNQVNVGEVMSSDLLLLAEDQGIARAIEAMRSKGVRRAPVVNEEGKLTGIVSVDDLLVLISHELSELAGLVQKQGV